MHQNESELDIQLYRTMLNDFETGLASILSEHTGFVTAQSGLSGKRDDILKEYGNSSDNIFLSLFKFRLENFHSEILRKLLDKNTPEIGNSQYLNLFVQLLRNINPRIREYTFADTVSVFCEAGEKREDGRIDIFIYDMQYGVIIENKINGAPDQANQLAKYLKFAKRMGKDIIGIVYIPPLYKNSQPPLDDYDESYQEYIPEIREKLVILPVTDTHTKKDLIHGFLGACLGLPENNDTQKYVLSQYAKLLISIKGATEMTKDIDMALLAECYKDKKSISIVENLSEVWSNREHLLGGLLRDTVRERLINELDFVIDDENEDGLYKGINDTVCLCFYSVTANHSYWVGFWSRGNIKGSIKEKLQEILDMVSLEPYFGKATDWDEPGEWLLKQFHIGEYKKPLTDIADYLIGRYRLLEEKAKQIPQPV